MTSSSTACSIAFSPSRGIFVVAAHSSIQKAQPMAKKTNTAKPAAIVNTTSPPNGWKFFKTNPGAVYPVGIDESVAVLVFRPSTPATIGRPAEAETAIMAKAKALGAVVRYQGPRQEIGRLRELLRTAQGQLLDAERHFQDATGDIDVTDLAYQVDAARLNVDEAQEQLDRFLPIARKSFEIAQQQLAKLINCETHRYQDDARTAYLQKEAELMPSIEAAITELATAKGRYLKSLRLKMFGVVDNLIGTPPPDTPAIGSSHRAMIVHGQTAHYDSPAVQQ